MGMSEGRNVGESVGLNVGRRGLVGVLVFTIFEGRLVGIVVEKSDGLSVGTLEIDADGAVSVG